MSKSPIHQQFIKYFIWVLTGFIWLGGLIGAVNDALSFVTWPVTIVGTTLIILSWIGIQHYLKHYPLKWRIQNRITHITRLNIGYMLPLVGMIILLWLPQIPLSLSPQEFEIVIAITPTPEPNIASISTSTPTTTPFSASTIIPSPIDTAIPTPVSLPFLPAKQEEILVIIAPFDGNDGIRPEVRIESKLRDELSTLSDLAKPVRIERYLQPIREVNSESELDYVQKTYNPTIIVWGWYDELGITASYKVAQSNGLNFDNIYKPSLTEVLRLTSAPDNFVFYVTRDLPQEVTHLTFFTIAQLYVSERKYDQAQLYTEKTIENLPPNTKGSEENALLLILAWIRVLGFDDFAFGVQVTSDLILKELSKELKKYAYQLRANSYELMSFYSYIKEHDISYTVSAEKMGGEVILTISSDREIPLEAFKSAEALQDYNYLIENLGEFENYYPRGRQNYIFGNTHDAIADMQNFIKAMGEDSFLASQAKQFVGNWSKELQ